MIASSPFFNCEALTLRWWSDILNPYSPHTIVVPLADPPVGTRGLPFRDLFFSGAVGKSQSPARLAVMENGRLDMGVTFFEGVGLRDDQGVERDMMGRSGLEAIESFSK